jgi:hypothetical protein
LHELGWIDGRNIRIDYRWSAGDAERTRKYAAELRPAPDLGGHRPRPRQVFVTFALSGRGGRI